jgi:hypothetical protein
MIVGRMMPATNKGIMMDITMGTGTLPQAKSTIIIGQTDMTILRKAYTMAGMPATTQDIVREEREIATITMMTRTNPSEPQKIRADLKTQFVHLFQEEFASAVNLHLDCFWRDPKQFSCLGIRMLFQRSQNQRIFKILREFADGIFHSDQFLAILHLLIRPTLIR